VVHRKITWPALSENLDYLRETRTICSMHTVCETHAFRRAAKDAGLTEQDVDRIVSFLADDPMAGDVIEGTGGCRKVRFAGRGRGKSGGYRTITFFSGSDMPVYLITVFAKGERSDLTKDQKNQLSGVTKQLIELHRGKVVKVGKRA
jgi:hypothetical protein